MGGWFDFPRSTCLLLFSTKLKDSSTVPVTVPGVETQFRPVGFEGLDFLEGPTHVMCKVTDGGPGHSTLRDVELTLRSKPLCPPIPRPPGQFSDPNPLVSLREEWFPGLQTWSGSLLLGRQLVSELHTISDSRSRTGTGRHGSIPRPRRALPGLFVN